MVTYVHNFPQMIFMAMHAFATCVHLRNDKNCPFPFCTFVHVHNSGTEIQSVSKTHDIICKQNSYFVLKFDTASLNPREIE